MNEEEKRSTLVNYLEQEIPGFSIGFKEESAFQKLITKVMFFNDYTEYVTTMYPKVWFSEREHYERYAKYSRGILEHEAVHLLDAQTFFGWLPFMPRQINNILFSVVYLQAPLAALALLALTGNLWWLLFLVFLAPLPAPFRTWAEIRGYRRSIELGGNPERIVAQFTGPAYFYMWPFASTVRKWLAGPSPYKDLLDALYEE